MCCELFSTPWVIMRDPPSSYMPHNRTRDIYLHILHVASAVVNEKEWTVVASPSEQQTRDDLGLGNFPGVVFRADYGGDVLMACVCVCACVYVCVCMCVCVCVRVQCVCAE